MKDGKPWRVRRAERAQAELEARRSRPPYKHPPVTPKPTVKRLPEDHNPHKGRKIVPWSPLPETWKGKVIHVVGGGPSLRDPHNIELMRMRSVLHTDEGWIAVNNAWKLCDWADILHFADTQWWRWHGKDVLANWPADRVITTATSDTGHVNSPRIRRFWRDRNDFTRDKMKLHGWDSGTQAVNLAYHLGASKVMMWGIDMCPAPDGETHWHADHPDPTHVPNYTKKFAPSLAETVRAMKIDGVPVVRATEPGIPEAAFEMPVVFDDKHP